VTDTKPAADAATEASNGADSKPTAAKKATTAAAKKVTYVAVEALRMGDGSLAFAPGQEVPANVLSGKVGKAYDWSSKVKKQ
jgi:xanthine dehydrogenase molybdopterin-binding subunit B